MNLPQVGVQIKLWNHHPVQSFLRAFHGLPPPKTNCLFPWNMMVGRLVTFPLKIVPFQGTFVNFRGCTPGKINGWNLQITCLQMKIIWSKPSFLGVNNHLNINFYIINIIWMFPKIVRKPPKRMVKIMVPKPYEQIRMIWGGYIPLLFLVQHPYAQ